MSKVDKHRDHLLIIRWILATVVGLSAGVIIQSVLMANGTIRMPDEPVMDLFPMGYTVGIILGSVQAIALKRNFSFQIQIVWVIANGFAFPLAEAISSVMLHERFNLEFGFYLDSEQPLLALIVVGTSAGLVISGIQAIVLMLVGVNPIYWIVASIVGFTMAIGLGDFLAVPEHYIFTVFGVLIGFVSGTVIYACITGYILKIQLVTD